MTEEIKYYKEKEYPLKWIPAEEMEETTQQTIARLEQERDELKKACEKCKLFDIEKTNRDLLERIDKLEHENKELSFAIEKCLENAGIECDDEEQALRSLTDLGSSHYKLLLEKEERNFKINQLKANGLYNDLTGIEFSAKVVELEQENKQIKSALEEIKKMVTNPYPGKPRDVLDIINEVLK